MVLSLLLKMRFAIGMVQSDRQSNLSLILFNVLDIQILFEEIKRECISCIFCHFSDLGV